MDRFDAASEPPFPRGTRFSDFPSYHVSSSGHAPALSSHNASDPTKPASRDGYGLGYGEDNSQRGYAEGHAEPGYGGYSYSSSYEDMRKTANEGGTLLSSRQYDGYGPDKGSFLRVSYEDPSFDPLQRASSGLSYGGVDGSRSSIKHHDLLQQAVFDSYPSQYNYSDLNKTGFTSLSKPESSYYDPPAAVSVRYTTLPPFDSTYPFGDTSVFSRQPYSTLPVGSTGAVTEYQQSSGLSRHYNSKLPETSGALGEWRGPVGRVHENEENGWQQSGSFLNNAQERYAPGKAGFGSEIENGGSRDLTKFGNWDGGVHGQVEVDRKGCIIGMHSESGSKIVDYNEGSLRSTKEKKRQSRWEPVEENEKNAQDGSEKKKKKTRWSEEKPAAKEVNLAEILKREDGELISLRAQLIVINRKLQSGKVVDERPEAERSPSPEPVYDNFGYRVNTREFRAREKLTKERQQIIATLSEKSPVFKPPPDFKQSKFSRKLPIPVDKYPDYNFVGLIIGPRGHTQKNMEKESGAKIFIRGKGSVREESSTTTETENLHVLIEADTEDSVNKAVILVEKLLVPVQDGENEHKKAQLRELASLNGTLRTSDSCHVCKDRHLAKDCPLTNSLKKGSSSLAVDKGGTRQDNLSCHICKGYGHLSKHCSSNHPVSARSLTDGPLGRGERQLTESDSWINNDRDGALLYVECLPVSVDEAVLQSLFSPFGKVVHAKVMRHPTTGISKSYGFVKFLDAADAAQAVTLMNGYKLNGKGLLVKLRSSVESAS